MAATICANMNVPHINEPVADMAALTNVVRSLKQGVESLGGHRGGPFDRAVTLSDLVMLGLVTEAQIMAALPNR